MNNKGANTTIVTIEGRTIESIIEFSLDSRSSKYARTLGGLIHAQRRRELLELRLRFKGLLASHESLEILCNKGNFHIMKTNAVMNARESKSEKNLILTKVLPQDGWEEMALQLNEYLKAGLEDSKELEILLFKHSAGKTSSTGTAKWVPLADTPVAKVVKDKVSTGGAPAVGTPSVPTQKVDTSWVTFDLVALRTSLKLSQKEIAEKLNITRSTYQHYERDNRVPKNIYDEVIKL